MGRIIAVANQKGGVGKTTTAINLSSALAELNQKVLVVDVDPQGNTTSGFGVDKNELEKTIYEMMLGEYDITDCIIEETLPNLSVLPANVELAAAEIELIGVEEKEYILKKAIAQVRERYDFVIIDCPPSLNMLTVNAMTTANTVLVPIQCEYYALEGVVFTMYDARTNLSLQVVENVKNNLNQTIYKTIIPRNVRLAEAPSHGLPINIYDPKSAGAESYQLLAEEVINRGKED